MGDDASTAAAASAGEHKDPRTIARKYQLDLCKRAVEENIIVYLGTGCGKTHIAVLLIYELGHLICKPSRDVCIFLAPTVPLVRQQAAVIANSTNFKVRSYYGSGRSSRDHEDWEKELGESEVLVMTPQILLHNLRHCFIKMNSIALLIFDECHHAQASKRHPYAQIMKKKWHPARVALTLLTELHRSVNCLVHADGRIHACSSGLGNVELNRKNPPRYIYRNSCVGTF